MATSDTAASSQAAPAVSSDEVDATTRPARRSTGRREGGGIAPWLFMAPYLTLFITFVVAPAIYGVWISLHAYDYTLPGKPWVGLDNYKKLFDSNSSTYADFWNSMQATGIFTLFSVPLLLAIPLMVALVMNSNFRGRNVFRALYFAPYVLGVALITLI